MNSEEIASVSALYRQVLLLWTMCCYWVFGTFASTTWLVKVRLLCHTDREMWVAGIGWLARIVAPQLPLMLFLTASLQAITLSDCIYVDDTWYVVKSTSQANPQTQLQGKLPRLSEKGRTHDLCASASHEQPQGGRKVKTINKPI